jgi:hypothetical protein
VQTSQATVVRILERLKKDPPDGGATLTMTTTPPSGMPMLPGIPQSSLFTDDTDSWPVGPPPQRQRKSGSLLVVALTLMLLGALAATLLAANGGLIARGKPGPAGPAGPAGANAPTRSFTICVRYNSIDGDVTSISAPSKGSCGDATLIKVPDR